MKTSPSGLAAIEAREGKRMLAYRDSAGVWTIGVGHTGRMAPPVVHEGMRITQAQCDAFLADDLAPVEKAIGDLGVTLTQNQFDACASLAFNIGVPGFRRSTVVRLLKAGDMAGAADAFLLWNKPSVLMARREAERRQFLTADKHPAPASVKPPAPAAAAPAPLDHPVPHAATKAPAMNPISGMLAGAKIASTALPIIFKAATSVSEHLPDIKAKFSELEGHLIKAYDSAKHLNVSSAKAELGAAWANGMAIYDDVGLPRDLVLEVQSVAAKDNTAASFVSDAEAIAKKLAKQFGIPV